MSPMHLYSLWYLSTYLCAWEQGEHSHSICWMKGRLGDGEEKVEKRRKKRRKERRSKEKRKKKKDFLIQLNL